MRRLTGVIAAAFLLTACSGGADTTSEEPTTEPLPKVSAATSCGQLFDGDAPAEKVVDLMTAEASASDGKVAESLASELDPIAEQADEKIGPHVEVVATELRDYADNEVGDSFDTSNLVTSLTELNNICGVTPRF